MPIYGSYNKESHTHHLTEVVENHGWMPRKWETLETETHYFWTENLLLQILTESKKKKSFKSGTLVATSAADLKDTLEYVDRRDLQVLDYRHSSNGPDTDYYVRFL
jgi:hypothetical protein